MYEVIGCSHLAFGSSVMPHECSNFMIVSLVTLLGVVGECSMVRGGLISYAWFKLLDTLAYGAGTSAWYGNFISDWGIIWSNQPHWPSVILFMIGISFILTHSLPCLWKDANLV